MDTQTPDIFTNVHKGIRRALFAACGALGRASEDAGGEARATLRGVLHFVAHHGENEDLLLLPPLRERAPEVHARIQAAHRAVEEALAHLRASLASAPVSALYHEACAFTALYLDHMREEELSLEPAIRAALTREELAAFARRAVERTAPADQRAMLGWMIPAMPPADAEQMLSRLPAELARELRAATGSPPRGTHAGA